MRPENLDRLLRACLGGLLGLAVEGLNFALKDIYVILEPLPAAPFLSGVLFGWSGIVGGILGQAVARCWQIGAIDLEQCLKIPLAYALIGVVGYIVFVLGRDLGRGFPNYRSYLGLGMAGAFGGMLTAAVLQPPELRVFLVHSASNFISILILGPPLMLLADSRLRRWMVPIRLEARLTQSFPTNLQIDAPTLRGVGVEARRDIRLRLGLLTVGLFALSWLIQWARSIPYMETWLLLVYLAPILWAALRYGLRGGLWAASMTGIFYLIARSVGERDLIPDVPGLYDLGHYAELLTFSLFGTFLGAQRETEAQLRRQLLARARQLALLNEMGDLLQASLDVDEAYRIVAQSAHHLFPGTRGMLAVPTQANLLESAATWGEPRRGEDPPIFAAKDCWALRRGQAHWVAGSHSAPICRHVDADYLTPYLCVPLIAQGEMLGVLHLAVDPQHVISETALEDNASDHALSENQRELAITTGKELALSLANVQLREVLREQSIRDPLTGLYNRRYMSESLRRELYRAVRHGQPCGLILLDIDHFKRFNDTFGHEAGDLVLRELARLLETRSRREDLVCRYGGEEIVLVLPGAPLERVAERAEALRTEVKQLALVHKGRPLGEISISLGVAAFPEHGAEEDDLLRAADVALYRAKELGRDRVERAVVEN